MTQPLDGRRILVTGGATGIGAAAVQVLTAAGASVVATYHRTTPPDRAGITWVQCDVRDSAAVDGMVGTAVETLGGLDVLLHAAGLWQPGIPGQISGEDIDFLVDTNIKAMIFVNQAAYAVMRKGGGGRIINFGSGEAVMGSPISALCGDERCGVCLDPLHRQGMGSREGVGDSVGASRADARRGSPARVSRTRCRGVHRCRDQEDDPARWRAG